MKKILFALLLGVHSFAPAHGFEVHPFIFGGSEVTPDDEIASHTVGLNLNGGLCSGTIIDTDLILTAAHCITDSMSVIFARNTNTTGATRRAVKDIRYISDENADEDIALLYFEGGVPAGYSPVKFSTARNNLRRGDMVTLAGYGDTSSSGNGTSGVLKRTEVSVKNPRYSSNSFSVDQTRGTGACYGDSGGPLYARVGNELVVYGLTSRIAGNPGRSVCASEVLYTDAGSHYSWIVKSANEMRSGRLILSAAFAESSDLKDINTSIYAPFGKCIATAALKKAYGEDRKLVHINYSEAVGEDLSPKQVALVLLTSDSNQRYGRLKVVLTSTDSKKWQLVTAGGGDVFFYSKTMSPTAVLTDLEGTEIAKIDVSGCQ